MIYIKTKSVTDYIAKIGATPNDSARADHEKICVLTMALFRRHTLCMARKSDEIRAQIFREAPKADYAVLPQERKQLRPGGAAPLARREQLIKKKGYEG